MNLSRKQLDFLKDELQITEDDIKSMTADEWHGVREKCADIEIEEAMDQEDGQEDTDREKIAVSIVDLTYKALMA